VPTKYRNEATGETWTGRGRAPKWLEGKNKDDYLIK
jgi:DNA-binding protein H-NS